MTTTPEPREPDARQESIAGAGGLELSVWGFRASAALLVAGVVLAAAEAPVGSALVRAGLIALMTTPALRVFDLLTGYVKRHDWGTVAAMLAVLAVVATTLFVALH
jgi:uncharacterized membrane protein